MTSSAPESQRSDADVNRVREARYGTFEGRVCTVSQAAVPTSFCTMKRIALWSCALLVHGCGTHLATTPEPVAPEPTDSAPPLREAPRVSLGATRRDGGGQVLIPIIEGASELGEVAEPRLCEAAGDRCVRGRLLREADAVVASFSDDEAFAFDAQALCLSPEGGGEGVCVDVDLGAIRAEYQRLRAEEAIRAKIAEATRGCEVKDAHVSPDGTAYVKVWRCGDPGEAVCDDDCDEDEDACDEGCDLDDCSTYVVEDGCEVLFSNRGDADSCSWDTIGWRLEHAEFSRGCVSSVDVARVTVDEMTGVICGVDVLRITSGRGSLSVGGVSFDCDDGGPMDFEGRLEELAADAEARISWWPPHVAALRRSAGEAGWRKPGELTFDGESSTVVCEGKPARWDPDATQFRCDEAALGARLAEERAHMERELAEGRFTTAWLLMSEPIESELRRRVEEGCRDAYLEASRRLSNPKVSAKLSLGWLAGQFDVEGRLSRGQRAHFVGVLRALLLHRATQCAPWDERLGEERDRAMGTLAVEADEAGDEMQSDFWMEQIEDESIREHYSSVIQERQRLAEWIAKAERAAKDLDASGFQTAIDAIAQFKGTKKSIQRLRQEYAKAERRRALARGEWIRNLRAGPFHRTMPLPIAEAACERTFGRWDGSRGACEFADWVLGVPGSVHVSVINPDRMTVLWERIGFITGHATWHIVSDTLTQHLGSPHHERECRNRFGAVQSASWTFAGMHLTLLMQLARTYDEIAVIAIHAGPEQFSVEGLCAR